MSVRVIGASAVRDLLPVAECVDVMERAMKSASAGDVVIPPRLFAHLYDESGAFGLMPGSSSDPSVYGAKVISLHPQNPGAGRPAIQGFVALFDHATGAPCALLDGGSITAIRTAAASGLATRVLAREDAASHGILGTGVQAPVHIDAIAAVRPVTEVRIWGRNPDKAAALARSESERTGLDVKAVFDASKAAECDVVSAVTGAREPILFGRDVGDGCHVNLVGAHTPDAREADTELVARAGVYTDRLESLFNEAGDVLLPIGEGRITRSHVRGEIGDVLLDRLDGRRNESEVTVYKSLGIVAQDLFAAYEVFQRARAQGIGRDVSFDD